MKKTLKLNLSILFFLLSLLAKAQQNHLFDTSVLKIPTPLLTQIGNYNHFDIYQSSPDNMIVIKPDSSIRFTMPNTAKQSIIVQTLFLKPKEK